MSNTAAAAVWYAAGSEHKPAEASSDVSFHKQALQLQLLPFAAVTRASTVMHGEKMVTQHVQQQAHLMLQ